MKKRIVFIFILLILVIPIAYSFSINDFLNKFNFFIKEGNLITGRQAYGSSYGTSYVCNNGQQIGDTNGDNIINSVDSDIVLNIIVENIPYPNNICCADVNKNGQITSSDSSLIQSIASGSSQSPGICGQLTQVCTPNTCDPGNNKRYCNSDGTSYLNCNIDYVCSNGQCVQCFHNWQCTSWSSCVNNQQTRTCTDLNNCGSTIGKPSEVQECTSSSSYGTNICTPNTCDPNNNNRVCNSLGTSYITCNLGQYCSNGQCTTPTQTCTSGCFTNNLRDCSFTTNGYKVCGDYNNDGCLEWGSVTQCNFGETCSNGQCSLTCTDECPQIGLRECSSNGYRICGNYDSDLCLEWGNVNPCTQTQTCLNGVCSSINAPATPNKCLDGTNYNECSVTKPRFCNSGTLVNKCSICGCPNNGECQLDGSCISKPIGRESSDLNLVNNAPIFSLLPSLILDKDQQNLNNLIILSNYSRDPGNQKLSFIFENKQKTFTSEIIDCFINDDVFSCSKPKKDGNVLINILASNGIKETSSRLSLSIISRELPQQVTVPKAKEAERKIFSIFRETVVGKRSSENKAPIANAGGNKNIVAGSVVILDASKSYDEDNNLPNSQSNYIWYKDGQEIGRGLNLRETLPPGTHKLTLQVIDAEGLSSTDTILVTVKSKQTCLDTNAIYVPDDTICNKEWPSQEGTILSLNSKGYSCNLVEVCSSDLDLIIEESIDCCDGTPFIKDQARTNACNFANKYSNQNTKKCQALYLTESLGGNSVYMKDYFEAEMCCKGVRELCSNELNLYSAKPLPKTGKDLSNLKCYNDLDNNPPGEWKSDTKLELNNIALSDIPAHASLNIISSGTCVDYSFALTTLLRKAGYKKDEVYTVEAPDHAYTLIKLPLDKKYTIVDTTGNNNPAIIFGSVPLGYKYCENIKNCYNDNGEVLCPDLNEIHGCEGVKQNLAKQAKDIGLRTEKVFNTIIKLVKTEIER